MAGKVKVFPAPPFAEPLMDSELESKLALPLLDYGRDVESAGGLGIHLDIGDGRFVQANSMRRFNFLQIFRIKYGTNLPVDAHLMVHRPTEVAYIYTQANIKYLSFHFEANEIVRSEPEDIYRFVSQLHEYRIHVGLAIKPETTLEEVRKKLPVLRGRFDYITIMTVVPGKQGAPFIDCTDKIKALKAARMRVQVDGGMNEHTSKIVRTAGLGEKDIIVTGSHYNKAKTPEERKTAVRSLRG